RPVSRGESFFEYGRGLEANSIGSSRVSQAPGFILVAAAGLRRASTAAAWPCFCRAGTRRAENRKLFLHHVTRALWATHFLACGEHNLLKTMMATTAAVFINRHKSSLGFGTVRRSWLCPSSDSQPRAADSPAGSALVILSPDRNCGVRPDVSCCLYGAASCLRPI